MNEKLTFLDREDIEFTFAFASFEDKEMYNKVYGECLQYMGTVLDVENGLTHEFRHRAIPGTNERKYWRVKASNDFHQRVHSGQYKGQWSK